MKFRLPAITALLGVALLMACDSGGSTSGTTQATPTGTLASAAPTVTVAQAAATQLDPTEQPTTTKSETTPTEQPAQAQATNTATAPKEPLTLQPVSLETNDTTRVGILPDDHKLTLPAGFHIKV